MASSPYLLCFLFTFFYLLFFVSSSQNNTPTTITIPLTATFSGKGSSDPLVFLHELASASRARAHRIKQGKSSPPIKKSLFPHSYRGHTATFSFGTPPQKLSYLLDTGSDVVWAPCSHYICTNCSFSANKVRKFDPKLSSTSKILDCKHSKCNTGCPPCKVNSKNCSRACLPYTLQYGTGAEAGYYLLENLIFPGKTIHNFVVGCTVLGLREVSADAMAGFARTPMSMPVQMGVKKFAYCLNSHVYDDTQKAGKLIFDYSEAETPGLSYAPILKNPPEFPGYYYLGIKYIVMGKELLRIPSKYLAPGSEGKGGVIIDSGFGFGHMAGPVYKIVTDELKKQMSMYRRSIETETETGVTPCYNYSGHKTIEVPRLIYHFTSGANMVVPGQNYFLIDSETTMACFPITTDSGSNTLEFTPGPSIILGNSQHTDYYVEYDLVKNRLGFRRQTC